ncbi:MAG TPA: adenylate/guanylate cyclase domain-containing protein [Acetobacteraceae bacterium]|nr:adenylate/guanylate cyclase domain-containing protein [Acetobacteraceae bacterium]
MLKLAELLRVGWVLGYRRVPWPPFAGALALLVALTAWVLASDTFRTMPRERIFDRILPGLLHRGPAPADIVIVDIDRRSLSAVGAWPWPRAQLARLVADVASAHPSVIALDLFLAGPDRWAPDGDRQLAEALAAAPTVLGFVLDTRQLGGSLPTTPVLTRQPIALPGLWREPGIGVPAASLVDAAAGFGALVMAADIDGPIRRMPLLVAADGAVRPSLAVEAVLIAGGGAMLLIQPGGLLQIADHAVPLGGDAQLRLPGPPRDWSHHTVSAEQFLNGSTPRDSLRGKIVLIGASAPELGGLRESAASLTTPSVWLQAEAIATILRGRVAFRPWWATHAEEAATLALGSLALLLSVSLIPSLASGLTLLLCVAWSGFALGAISGFRWLLDPLGPPAIALIGFIVAMLCRFARDEWRARMLRLSFEQHLASDVVRRIAADPGSIRLRGEMREITALFTDIEGFTSMTERAAPTDLVALLDAYFEATTRIITDHGGMIDKIVGDAIHAIFNAPFSLPDHPRRAVESALALLQVSETMRASPLGRQLQLGRTRVGIETGAAIVGDVGGGRKLDYTAHGNAMNAAARLEAANKEFGSSICIGPGTAEHLDPATLRPIGTLVPRGQSREVSVYTLAVLPAATP